MKFYAEVINNFIRNAGHIFPDNFNVQYDPSVLAMVDIYNVVPVPSEGDYWNIETGEHIATWDFPATISSLTLTPNGIDTISITNLPAPCAITIDDIKYEVNDGEFEFTTDLAGTYVITAEAFPYLPKEWEVTAA